MADLHAAQIVGETLLPASKPSSVSYGGRLRRFRAVLNLGTATTTTGSGSDTVLVTTADNVRLARIPAGYAFAFGIINASATLGSSVVAVGTNKVHASNGQLRAAATFTTANVPTLFGLAAAEAAGPYAVDTDLFLTVATANLPTSGTVIIDLFFAGA